MASSSPPSPWRYWSLPLLWTLVILVVSGDLGASRNTTGLLSWLLSLFIVLSPATLDLVHGWLRKAAHVLTYSLLFLFWCRALLYSFQGRRPLSLSLGLGLCLAVALLDEGRQALMASRTGSLADVALDLAGPALLVVVMVITGRPRLRKN